MYSIFLSIFLFIIRFIVSFAGSLPIKDIIASKKDSKKIFGYPQILHDLNVGKYTLLAPAWFFFLLWTDILRLLFSLDFGFEIEILLNVGFFITAIRQFLDRKKKSMNIEKKKVVVFGGSEGIGFGIALSLYRKGADIILVSRSEEKLKKAIQDIKDKGGYKDQTLDFLTADLCQTESTNEVCSKISSKFGLPDTIIYTAGTGLVLPPSQETLENINLNMNSTFTGSFRVTNYFIPLFLNSEKSHKFVYGGGSFVQDVPFSGTGYLCSRAAYRYLAKTVNQDLRNTKISVLYCDPPGISDSPFFQTNSGSFNCLPFAKLSKSKSSIQNKLIWFPTEQVGDAITYAIENGISYYSSPSIHLTSFLGSNSIFRPFVDFLADLTVLPPEEGGFPSIPKVKKE